MWEFDLFPSEIITVTSILNLRELHPQPLVFVNVLYIDTPTE